MQPRLRPAFDTAASTSPTRSATSYRAYRCPSRATARAMEIFATGKVDQSATFVTLARLRRDVLNVLGRRPQHDASDVTPRPASENVECTKRGMTSALWGMGRCDRGRRRRRWAIRQRQARPLCAKGRCKRREDRVRQCAGRHFPLRTRHQRAFKQRGLATAIFRRSFGGTARAVHELSIPTLDGR